MQTNNGSQGQSGYTGQQMASNGAHAHPGLDRQQGTHFKVTHPATPYQTWSSHGIAVPHGTLQAPQDHTQGQLGGDGQQVVDLNGTPFSMRSNNNSSAGVSKPRGYQQQTQIAHCPVQPGFAQHMVNSNDWHRSMVNHTRDNGTAGPSDFWITVSQQPEQFQNDQHYHKSQNPQAVQNYGVANSATNFGVCDNPSGGNILNIGPAQFVYQSTPSAEHPNSTGTPHHTGSKSPAVAMASPEVSEDLQDRVNELVNEKGTTYKGHIRNKADYARYKQAVYRARSKNSKLEDKSADYPIDEAKQVEIFQRIYDAFLNTDGNQDRASDSVTNDNCLAYRTVQGLSGIEVELIAHEFVDNMLSVQRGEPILPPHFKVVQEKTFMGKVDHVVESLRFNKLLCRSATMNSEFIARIAADPVGERTQKNLNQKNNSGKNTVLKAEAKKMGKSRKTKRAAEAEPEADTQDKAQAAAEVMDPVVASQTAA